MRTLRSAAVLLLATGSLLLAQNFPFPMAVDYGNGCIKPSVGQAQMNADIISSYNDYKTRFLAASTGTAGGYYIRSSGAGVGGGSAITISEAMGYGMIITVLMAGYDPDARTIYDGMLKFWADHPSSEMANFMAWEVPADRKILSSDAESNASAADGDMDMVYSLILADRQWGSTGAFNYLQLAKTKLTSSGSGIASALIHSGTKRIMFGDFARWGLETGGTGTMDDLKYNTRSSDWMPAHLRTYANIVQYNTHRQIFLAAADSIYALVNYLQANSSPSTGLLPDFIKGANPVPDNNPVVAAGENNMDKFAWNACRDPLRLVMDYTHFGTGASKTAVSKMVDWAVSETGNDPGSFYPGYTLDGYPLNSNYTDRGFIAPMVAGAVCDSRFQSFLDEGWTVIKTPTSGAVYQSALQLLSMLAISGNWWNPAPTNVGIHPVADVNSTRSSMVTSTSNAIQLNLVKSGTYQLEIFGMNGGLIRSAERNLGAGVHVIPTAGLAQGMYLVTLRGADGLTASSRVVVGR